MGLLLEIGHAAMYIKAPELALRAIQESRDLGRPLEQVEHDYFGFDYCQLGATLMRHWRLPEVYPQIVGCHLAPAQSMPSFRNAAEIAGLAHQYCENLGEGNPDFNRILANHLLFSNFPEDSEEVLSSEIGNNVDEVYEMLSPPHTASWA